MRIQCGLNSRSEVSRTDGSVGKNSIIFGIHMISYVHIDNKGKDILILGKGPTQRLDDTTLTAEVQYSINFSRSSEIFFLNLHYYESNSFCLLMLQKYINSKQKILK